MKIKLSELRRLIKEEMTKRNKHMSAEDIAHYLFKNWEKITNSPHQDI